MPKKHPPRQKAYEVTFKLPKMVLSEMTPGGDCGKVSNPVLSGKGPESEGTYNRFSCFAVHRKWLKAPMLRVSPWQGCTQTLIQTIGLR